MDKEILRKRLKEKIKQKQAHRMTKQGKEDFAKGELEKSGINKSEFESFMETFRKIPAKKREELVKQTMDRFANKTKEDSITNK